MQEDKFKDQCGVFGIYDHKEAAKLAYLGLFALQHRGQESAGIVTSDGYRLYSHKGMGLVAEVFSDESLKKLYGKTAIGHTRYSTAGDKTGNIQPLTVTYGRGQLSISHNGNLINAESLRKELEDRGSIFQTSLDSEVIVHLIARSKKRKITDAVKEAISQIRGAYSLLLMTPTQMIGVRDPWGFRPLCLGRLNGSHVLASESCALDLIKAKFIREIEPGEIVVINNNGLKSRKTLPAKPSHCIFEFVYFARPDSNIFGCNVHRARRDMGRALAKEHPAQADIVIPIPDSGIPAAMGYSRQSRIRYDWGLVKNRYVGRTFIAPTKILREVGVKIKLNALNEVLKGRRVVVVDDSIVRGTTCRKIIKMIRIAGASEVHLRISSPPVKFPCFYGIDTPTRKELIAYNHTIDEIKKYVRVDSLGYLSIGGMLNAMAKPAEDFCTACFDGKYPVEWER
ncbi:amidophosphoribosyltransferase [bacterium]|nr:amidophosphoribosyltransferase [bacterium]MBU1615336.1 amidophosphoribosyltransferase [bacterium]